MSTQTNMQDNNFDEGDEEVSLPNLDDEDMDEDEVSMGSVAASTLAALCLHDTQRPRSAMSARKRMPGVTRRKRFYFIHVFKSMLNKFVVILFFIIFI